MRILLFLIALLFVALGATERVPEEYVVSAWIAVGGIFGNILICVYYLVTEAIASWKHNKQQIEFIRELEIHRRKYS